MDQAEKMREKQRKAELKKQGIVEEEPETKKEFNDDFLKKFEEVELDGELPENSKVWKCSFTGDVMFSDGYTMEPILDNQAMEVKAEEISLGGETVVNLVAQH